MRKLIVFFLLYYTIVPLFAQNGGEKIYQFVELPNSAHVAALGENFSIKSEDLSFALKNPALLDSTHHRDASASWGGIAGGDLGINQAYIAFAYKYRGITYSLGTQFINYGAFDEYDEFGNSKGEFNAGDYMFFLTGTKQLSPKLSAGMSFKPVISSLASYVSFGILADLGVAYNDTASLFSAGLVLRNVGIQILTYTEDNREELPWSLDMSFTKKFKHAPLRFSITYQDLQKFRLDYDSPLNDNAPQQFGEESTEESWFEDVSDNFLRHISFSTELLLGKSLYGVYSFNFKKRKELAVSSGAGMTGMAIGFGLKMQNLHISYGRSIYHIAGASNYLTLEMNFWNVYDKLKRSRSAVPSTEIN